VKSDQIFSRILLTVLIVGVMLGLGYWAWAGLPWLALLLFVLGVAALWWLWKPVVAHRRHKSAKAAR
jgi:hypothetical protein